MAQSQVVVSARHLALGSLPSLFLLLSLGFASAAGFMDAGAAWPLGAGLALGIALGPAYARYHALAVVVHRGGLGFFRGVHVVATLPWSHVSSMRMTSVRAAAPVLRIRILGGNRFGLGKAHYPGFDAVLEAIRAHSEVTIEGDSESRAIAA